MPATIENQVKDKVINQWFSCESRDKIATDNGSVAGTVSGIAQVSKPSMNRPCFYLWWNESKYT